MRWCASIALLLLSVAAAVAACAVPSGAVAARLNVTTSLGVVEGFFDEDNNVLTFLGIPYAEPPVGSLRWQPPQPARPHVQPLRAWTYGSACWQYQSPHFDYLTGVPPAMSEDCLTLNIFVPNTAPPAGGFAVRVWIHGGGYSTGWASLYPGGRLASMTNTLIVVIQYRLNVLGFATFAALQEVQGTGGGASSNFGFEDQQEALAWVGREVAAFGGNPRNVMIDGESAGGGSVMLHTTAPRSCPWFRKAIVQSPAPSVFVSCAQWTSALASFWPTSCTSLGSTQQVVDCLRAYNASSLLQSFLPIIGLTSPCIDGFILPQEPFAAWRASATVERDGCSDVERGGAACRSSLDALLVTRCASEGNFLAWGIFGMRTNISQAQFSAFAASLPPSVSQAATDFYSRDSVGENYFPAVSALIGDYLVTCGAYMLSSLVARAGVPVWMAQWVHHPQQWDLSFLNATHMSDLAFTFATTMLTENVSLAEEPLLKTALSAWTDLHLTGTLPWPQFLSASNAVNGTELLLDIESSPAAARPPPGCAAVWNMLILPGPSRSV